MGVLQKDERKALVKLAKETVALLNSDPKKKTAYLTNKVGYLQGQNVQGDAVENIGLYTVKDYRDKVIPGAKILKNIYLTFKDSAGEDAISGKFAEIDFLLYSKTKPFRLVTAKSQIGQISSGIKSESAHLEKMYHSLILPPNPRNLAILFKVKTDKADKDAFRHNEKHDEGQTKRTIGGLANATQVMVNYTDDDGDNHVIPLDVFRKKFPLSNNRALKDLIGESIGVRPRDSESDKDDDKHLSLSVTLEQLQDLLIKNIDSRL